MLRISLLVGFVLFFEGLVGQVFWTEDFGTDVCAVTENVGIFSSANGNWSMTETGVHDDQGNIWYVSAREAGMGEGACGDGCGDDAGLLNKTLHISTTPVGDNGAAYLESPFGFTDSDIRAESPFIDCTGQSDIVLNFLYIAGGTFPSDACTVQYFDGADWTDLEMLAPTPLDCAPQGTWTAYSINLPASADNNPNVMLGFRWMNVDDNIATDPSVAIDDITLSSGSVASDVIADFSANVTDICTGECIDFTDLSTGDGIDTWTWTFNGAETASSTDQNPVGICYETAGTYSVTLLVSSPDGTDELTLTDYITVQECASPPVADFSASLQNICVDDCIDFTDLSTGDGIDTWTWTFDGADTPSSFDQNPAGICYATPGQYTVTLEVSNAEGADVLTMTDYITVDACLGPPEADFSASQQNICEGDCIDFTDLSVGAAITDWEWTFNGADTPTSTDQNPTGVCFATAGSFDVTLSVTNAEGTDEITLEDYIVVSECAGPVAGFSASETVICEGDCIDFIDESLGGAVTYSWIFNGADTPASADANPAGICYATAGVYDVTLLVSDGVEDNELTLPGFITVEACGVGPAPQLSIGASEQVICLDACVNFEDLSGGTPDSWLWSFEGANPPMSFDQNAQEVCYNNAGSYDVTLEITVDGVSYDSTFTDFITVVDSCGPVASFDYTPIVCLGQCYSFESTSTGGDTFFWTFEGALPETSEEENPAEVCYLDATGNFTVTLQVTNEFGSSDNTTQQISVVNPPIVNAGPDQTIVQGTSTTVSATGGNGTGEFVWQPFENVNCFDCPVTQTTPLQETTHFVVYYEQSGGCQSTDTVTVFVNNDVFAVGVPTSFSPNGDGHNDILYPRGNNITKLNFIVYNRYGQEVFETQSAKEIDGWDGTMNGRELNAGVFGYYLEAYFADGTSSVTKGNITLVR